MKRQRNTHRALALIMSLVLVALAVVVSASVIYMSAAGVEASAVSRRLVQSRSLAWSGVQMVMAELDQQRDEILSGDEPDITDSWSLPGESQSDGTARIVSAGPLLADESAKLNINTATAEMLAGIEVIDDALAARIIARRDAQPLGSLEDLLEVDGITIEMFYGPDGIGGIAKPSEDAGVVEGALPLRDLFTVFSFDPNIQRGAGSDGSFAGNRRINLNISWSEELERALKDRFGDGATNIVRQLMNDGTKFESESDLVGVLTRFNVDADDWVEPFDVFSFTDAEYLVGRININAAPVEVLACVPGISPEAAEQIAQRRETMAKEMSGSICWPLVEGLVTDTEFKLAAPFLTTGSMQWRVVVEGGFLRAVDAEESNDDDAGRLEDRVVLEAVIDISSKRPRIAYLRDVTWLPIASRLQQRREAQDELAFERPDQLDLSDPFEIDPLAFGPLDLDRPLEIDDLDIGVDLTRPGMETSRVGDAPDTASNTQPVRIGRWNAGRPATEGSGR